MENAARGEKKIRGNTEDGNEMFDVFMGSFDAFKDVMQKVESDNPTLFASFKDGLNGVLEDKAVGDTICTWDKDQITLELEDLDAEDKAKIMCWIRDNKFFIFESTDD